MTKVNYPCMKLLLVVFAFQWNGTAALSQSTCGEVKLAYGSSECCGSDTAGNDASCFVEATSMSNDVGALKTRTHDLEIYTGVNFGECASVLDTTSDLSAFTWRSNMTIPHTAPDGTTVHFEGETTIGCFSAPTVGLSGVPACPDLLGNEFVSKDAFRKPCESMALYGIEPGMKVADLGVIAGYWLPFFAQAVGALGKVYYGNQPVVSKNDVPWYVHKSLMVRDAAHETGVVGADGLWSSSASVLTDMNAKDREVFRRWYNQIIEHASYDRTDLGEYTKWIYDYDAQVAEVAAKSSTSTGAPVLPIQGLNDADGERTFHFGDDQGKLDRIFYQYTYNRQIGSPFWGPDENGNSQFKAIHDALKPGGKLFVVDFSNGEGSANTADRSMAYCSGVHGFDLSACNMTTIRNENKWDEWKYISVRSGACTPDPSFSAVPVTLPTPYNAFGQSIYYEAGGDSRYFNTATEMFGISGINGGLTSPWSKSQPESPFVDPGVAMPFPPANVPCPKKFTGRVDARVPWTEAMEEGGFESCRMRSQLHDARDDNMDFYLDAKHFYVRDRFVLECTKASSN